ncbi:relaxase/mobilization nuclease domain-containing protein [Salegentibacter sp. F14]
MIGKGTTISNTQASVKYGWNRDKGAQVVFTQHLAADTPKEITVAFRLTQEQNAYCVKNTLSFILSPTIAEGKNLKNRDLARICKEFMQEMKLKDRQAIAFVHKDKAHKHIHLYVNRIDFKGKAYNAGFLTKRSYFAAEKVAERLRMTTVKQVQNEKLRKLLPVRTEIKKRHDLTLKQFQPRTYPEYMKGMKDYGVKVIPSINKANKLQGFRFQFGKHSLKGFEIHPSMSGGNIGKSLSRGSGISNFLKENSQLKIAGKTVSLSAGMIKVLTRKIIKPTISKGLDTGIEI